MGLLMIGLTRSLTHSRPRRSLFAMTPAFMLIMPPWRVLHQRKHISSPFSILPAFNALWLCGVLTACSSVTIVSDAFESKMQPARHRMVYALFKEEMAREGGLHALQLKTQTPAEEQREKERKQKA